MDTVNENYIEWIRGDKIAAITLSQGRYKTKIERLAKERPDECQIIERNDDGSLFAHVPVSWVKISPPRECTLSEEQRREAAERLKLIRKAQQ